jgi:uroporphyrinogen decarboxylase
MMRQAGRSLPEYRALRRRHTFHEMIATPELAVEVTLQPFRRFGVDGAVLFSDILVVLEGMGLGYRFEDGTGIRMERSIRTRRDIERLEPKRLTERVGYVYAALGILHRELDGRAALIGFAGSPWTLANFALEGHGSRDGRATIRLYFQDKRAVDELLSRLTEAVIAHCRAQARAGADVIQIFDSYAGLLPSSLYDQLSGRWIRRIVRRLAGRIPVIVFAHGQHGAWESVARTGADVAGIDAGVSLAEARRRLPRSIALQGNLDPSFLLASPRAARAETRRVLEELRGTHGHIFNLGHGVPADAALDAIEAVVETVRRWR